MTSVTTYEQDLIAWHEKMETSLRSENGWLSLAGLFWLHEGDNTIGSAPECEILLPEHSVPASLGTISFQRENITLRTSVDVTIDGNPAREAILNEDVAEDGPTRVAIGSVRFYVIKRADQYGVRVIDQENPALKTFKGRQWFAIDPAFHVEAKFMPHETVRTLSVINSVGLTVPMENPGVVQFELSGQTLQLEAFDSDPGELWFIFKDQTNGTATYGAGRFLVAPVSADGVVDLDFNKSYSPPCAFTAFATCPFAPRENHLPIRIEAGERL